MYQGAMYPTMLHHLLFQVIIVVRDHHAFSKHHFSHGLEDFCHLCLLGVSFGRTSEGEDGLERYVVGES